MNKNNWTPCSRKQPDWPGYYFVTVFGSDVLHLEEGEDLLDAFERNNEKTRYTTVACYDFDGETDKYCWFGDYGYPLNPQPVAWMEYPEPWDGISNL